MAGHDPAPGRKGLSGCWRRRCLRARVTLASTAGLAVALAAAAVLLSPSLAISLVRGVDNQARQGALEVAALAKWNRLPTNAVPFVPGTSSIQVLDARGRIVNVSTDAVHQLPLLRPSVAARNAREQR